MSYYKTIDAQKMDAGLLETADRLAADRGDGRISRADAEALLKAVQDGGTITATERETIRHIREHFNWTDSAGEWFDAAFMGVSGMAGDVAFGIAQRIVGGLIKDKWSQMGPMDKAVLGALGFGPSEQDKQFHVLVSMLLAIDAELAQIEHELKKIIEKVDGNNFKNGNRIIHEAIATINKYWIDVFQPYSKSSTQPVKGPNPARYLRNLSPGDQQLVRQNCIDLMTQVSKISEQIRLEFGSVMIALADWLADKSYTYESKLAIYLKYYKRIISWMLRGTALAKLAFMMPDSSGHSDPKSGARDTAVAGYLEFGEQHRKQVIIGLATLMCKCEGACAKWSTATRQDMQPAPIGHVDRSIVDSTRTNGKAFEWLEDLFSAYFPSLSSMVRGNAAWAVPGKDVHPPNHITVYTYNQRFEGNDIPLLKDMKQPYLTAQLQQDGKPTKELSVYSLMHSPFNFGETCYWAFYRQEFWGLKNGISYQVKDDPNRRVEGPNVYYPYYNETYEAKNAYQFPGPKNYVYPDSHNKHWPGRGENYATIRFQVNDFNGAVNK